MSRRRGQRGEVTVAENAFIDERLRAEADYQRKIVAQQIVRQETQYDHDHALRTQNLLAAEPPMEQVRIFSLAWFRDEGRDLFQNAPTGGRRVLILLSLVGVYIGGTFLSYVFRFVFGLYYYSTAYFWAYNGFDSATRSCDKLKDANIRFLAWGLSNEDWYQVMRCSGYANAMDLDGGLSPLGQALATLILDPFAASPPLYILVLSVFVWQVLPRITRRVHIWAIYAWYADRPFGAKVFYILFFTSIMSLVANKLDALAFFGGLFVTSIILIYILIEAFLFPRVKIAWELAKGNTLAGPILAFISWAWTTKSYVPVGKLDHCFHINSCDCYIKENHKIEDLTTSNEALKGEVHTLQTNLAAERRLLENAKTNIDLISGERDKIEARLLKALPSPGYWHAPRHDDARSSHWERMYNERDADYLQLANKKWEQEKSYKLELERLQTAIKYSQGAGIDRENAIKELDEARATIRTLERERNTLSLAGMSLRQELAKEKETQSEQCHSDARCQRRIRELEDNYDLAMSQIRGDQTLVTEACVTLGMDRKEAEHKQLREYLTEATIQLAKLHAVGVRGADTTDLQVELMRKEVARESTYRNRLERELERLGGNILDIRMGLDTTRPQDWKVDFITYEQNLLRIFPIYQRAWSAINDMYGVFTRENLLPPGWLSHPPRNNMSSKFLELQSSEALLQIIRTNEITNPTHESFEILVEKLVWKECMRLYNHGLEMLVLLDSNMTLHAHVEGIEVVDTILNEVLHEVLDFVPALLDKHPTERSLSPRKQKKFEIYSAMQTAIAGLLMQIIANKRLPPDWLSTQTYDDRFNKPYDTPENLVANLCNLEMTILAKRIQQLVAFTEEYHLPGTRAGPPRAQVQHDPTYIERWDHLVIARTFAELTISHWNVHKSQKEILYTDEAGRQLIRFEPDPQLLPLNKDKFRLAVGLAPIKKEDNDWPKEWKAKMIQDPSSGPYILFEPPPSAGQQARMVNAPGSGIDIYSNNNNNNNHNNAQGAPSGTPKEMERKKLQNEWHQRQERCEQLYNHLVTYGIKHHIPRLSMPTLRANADLKSIKRDIEGFKELENQYVFALTGGPKKYPVPPMRKNGGRMEPW